MINLTSAIILYSRYGISIRKHLNDYGWSLDLPTFRKMQNIDWAVASLPEGPKGKATYIAGESLAIFKQSKNPDAAWTFVKWVTRPEFRKCFQSVQVICLLENLFLTAIAYKAFLETDHAMKSFVEQIKIARQRPTIERYYVTKSVYCNSN